MTAVLSTTELLRLPGEGELPLSPWPGEPVDVDGSALFVRRAPVPPGGGEPALFVHGLGGGSTNWTDLMALLSGRLAGEAVDLPGFGHSDPPPGGRYSLDAHVRAVVRLVEIQARGPVHLVGNSLGGAVAVRLAAEHPGLVRTLTLVSPALPAFRLRRYDPTLSVLMVPGLSTLGLRRLARLSPEQRAEAVLRLCYADISRLPAERLAEAVAEIRRRRDLAWTEEALVGSLRGVIAAQLQPGGRGLWQQARAVAVPTLVVWGREDRVVDVTVGVRAQQVFPDARLLVLDDVGHVAQLERPEVVARAILGMLEGLGVGTRSEAAPG